MRIHDSPDKTCLYVCVSVCTRSCCCCYVSRHDCCCRLLVALSLLLLYYGMLWTLAFGVRRKGCDQFFLRQLSKSLPNRLVYVTCVPFIQASGGLPKHHRFVVSYSSYSIPRSFARLLTSISVRLPHCMYVLCAALAGINREKDILKSR